MTLDAFVKKHLGKKIDWDGAYGGQCVDLFRQYVQDVLELPQPKGVVGAADFWANYGTDKNLKDHYEKIPNTPTGVPKKGDVMLWNKRAGGGYGHVAVFLEGDVNEFTSFDQNWPTLSVCTITQHDYKNVLGWLRPKNDVNEGIKQPSEPISDTFAPNKALPPSWYEIDEAKEAIRRDLITSKDAWDTVMKKFVDVAKELNKQKAFFDSETESLIKTHKVEMQRVNEEHANTIESLQSELDSYLVEKSMATKAKTPLQSKMVRLGAFTLLSGLALLFGVDLPFSEEQLQEIIGAFITVVGALVTILRLFTNKPLTLKK